MITRQMFTETSNEACTGVFLLSANEVCEGYVFTGVCLSTGGGSAPLHAGIHPPGRHHPGQTPPQAGQTPPQPSACWDTVNKWAVRILLECNLVTWNFCFLSPNDVGTLT